MSLCLFVYAKLADELPKSVWLVRQHIEESNVSDLEPHTIPNANSSTTIAALKLLCFELKEKDTTGLLCLALSLKAPFEICDLMRDVEP
jgi:hypothetical protein